MCSHLYISRIYDDNNLHQTQTKTSHVESSYEKQYVALTIFSNPKHTSVSRSIAPSWVSALTRKRWDPRSIGYFSTYIEITNSKSHDAQGGKRIILKSIMTVMIVLAEHLKRKLLGLAPKKSLVGCIIMQRQDIPFFPSSFINDAFEKWSVYITTIMHIVCL